MKKTGGTRQGTRNKLKKGSRDKNTVNQFLREFKVGEKARISIEPSSHKGMPDVKFDGAVGKIKERRGQAYILEVQDGNSEKTIIAKPEHLVEA